MKSNKQNNWFKIVIILISISFLVKRSLTISWLLASIASYNAVWWKKLKRNFIKIFYFKYD